MNFDRDRLATLTTTEVAELAQRLGTFLQNHHETPEAALVAMLMQVRVACEQDALDFSRMHNVAGRVMADMRVFAPEHMGALRDFTRWFTRETD